MGSEMCIRDRFGVDKTKMFTRLSGYQQLIETDVDAVAIESPPYFHPEQAQAAVAAGKHVYLAKPVAIDVPGCNTISESANKATSKNQVFLVDFQTRTDPYYIEAVKRVHEGAIGEIAFAESNFQGDGPWKKWFPLLQEDSKNPENRLRGWGCFRTLAGDIIVEQSIHSIDVDTWLLDKAPLSAVGAGGNRTHPVGDVLDWLTLFYEYEGNIGINFGGRQFNGHGTKGGITNRMFGSKGVLEAQYGGQVLIRGEGENFYKGGRSPGIYQEGAERNIASFHDHITNKNYENATVPPSVRSTMTSILGRNAGYTGERITWQELVKDTSRLEPDLDGLLT